MVRMLDMIYRIKPEVWQPTEEFVDQPSTYQSVACTQTGTKRDWVSEERLELHVDVPLRFDKFLIDGGFASPLQCYDVPNLKFGHNGLNYPNRDQTY